MKRPRRWLFPTFLTLALMSYVGWIIARGLSPGAQPYFRTEISPGISGVVLEPPNGTPIVSGTVVVPRTGGWDTEQADRAASLARAGSLVVVIDYYRGGRDVYHGTPNEFSEELLSRWRTNLIAGLAWVDNHRRGLPWTIVAPSGRPAELLRALAPLSFTFVVGP